MNDISPQTELDAAVLDVLTHLRVSVIAGPIFSDSYEKPLSRDGAQAVLDRLRARGFKVTRSP
jgi:hypothetical protein